MLDFQKVMTDLGRKTRKKFMYNKTEIPVEQVFSFKGGLPLLVRRAGLLHDFLFGEGLKVTFKPDVDALTGERVEISDKQSSFVLIMLLYDVLEEMVVNSGKGDILLS
jgi:hypothetical protein